MARGEVARMFVAIGADVHEAVKGVQQVRGDLGLLQRDTKRSADAWSGFTGSLARTGLAIQGIREIGRTVKDISSGIFSLALGADQDRVSMDQLIGSVRNTGRAIDDGLRAKLDGVLQSMQDTTLFSDNELRDALQTLVIGTGNVDEAISRLPIAMDLAAREQLGLSQASRLFARINDDSLTELNKYGIGLDQTAEKSGDLAAAQLLAARAHITVDGALKAVGNESIRKRWGIPDPKDIKGAVNEAALLAEARKTLAGGAVQAAGGLEGDADQVAKGLKEIRNELGALIMPLAKGGIRFLADGLKGVRRLIMLFSTDISGPRIGGVRKLWKEIFGTEMPKALGAVVDGFDTIKKRIEQFVKDINAPDEDTVRGAIKNLVEGLKTDIPKAFGDIGTELDKLGPVGFGLKLLATGVTIEKLSGGLLSPLSIVEFLRDSLQITWLTVSLLGGAPTFTLAATVVLGWELNNIINLGASGNKAAVFAESFKQAVMVTTGVAAGFIAVSLGAPVAVSLAFAGLVYLTFDVITKMRDTTSGENSASQKGLWAIAKASCQAGGGLWDDGNHSCTVPTHGNFTGDSPGETGQTAANTAAGFNDVVAAYKRITGNAINPDYAAAIAAQGFSMQQAMNENIFAGTVRPAMASPGNIREFAMGGSGIATEPTLLMAGDRGAERFDFHPVGSSAGGWSGSGDGGMSINVPINIGGSVIGVADLEDRVRQAVRDGVQRGGFRGVLAT